MKKYFSFVLVGLVAGLVSCSKDSSLDVPGALDPNLMAFSVVDLDIQNHTKAAVVDANTLKTSGFYVSYGTGGASNWTNVKFDKSSSDDSKFVGGKFWPEDMSASTHAFAASNKQLTIPNEYVGGKRGFYPYLSLSKSDLATDIVSASLSPATYKTLNTLTFRHLFSRIGKVTVAAETGYTISNVTITFEDRWSDGTWMYDMLNGSYVSSFHGVSSSAYRLMGGSPAATYNLYTGASVGNQDNDIYFFPVVIDVKATWTATKGDYSQTYTVSTIVTLEQGKVNNLSTTLGGNSTEIVFGVSVESWGSVSKVLSFPTS